jgi:hypothetical protein
MAFTAGFSVNVGDPTKASDVDVLAANDDYLKNAIDTFIANDANNRVLTATGSGTANAETNLTFDGSTLTVTGTVSATTLSGNVTGGTISGTTGTFSDDVTVGTTDLIVDVSANKVGIGGTPTEELDIQGSGATQTIRLIRTDASTAGGITINSANGSNYVYNTAAKDLVLSADNGSTQTKLHSNGDFSVNTSLLFVDQSASAVGVGTSSPAGLGARSLNIKAPTANGADLTFEADNGTNFGVLFSGATTNDPFSIYSNTGFKFATASDKNATGFSEKMRLDTSGNMGLGVVPTSGWSGRTALEIEGASTGYVTSPNGPIAIGSNIYYNGGDKFVGNGYAPLYALSSGNHIWYTSNNNTSGAGAAVTLTQAMTLTNAGLLGLGTASPQAMLDTTGLIRSTAVTGIPSTGTGAEFFLDSGVAYFQGYNRTGSAFVETRLRGNPIVLDGGSVGIGTSSPSSLLNLESASTPTLLITDTRTPVSAQYQVGSSIAYVGTTTNHALGFTTNGSERARIDSSGNVGIGTTSPSESLTNRGNVFIETNSTSADSGNGLFWQSTTSGWSTSSAHAAIYGKRTDASNGYLRFDTRQSGTTQEAMRLTSAGNLGLGTASPAYKLVVSNGGAAGYEFNINGLNGGVNTLTYNRSTSAYVDSAHFVDNYYIYSGQTPAERFRVESTGVCAFMTSNVNIRFNGTATSTVLTNNNGVEIYTGGFIWAARQDASLYLNRAGSTGEIASFRYDNVTPVGGISVTSSATAYNTSSDYRLKENLAPITGAVDRVNALQPRRFNFISDPDTTVDGFVAHEVSSVVPEAITGEKDAVDEDGNPEYQGIDQSKLVPLLTAAIQELTLTTQELTARIEALEAA